MADATEPDYAANIEDLDRAIKKYMSENLDMEGLPIGWVLLCETARFDDDGETWYRFKYSCGPQMSVSSARGLIENCRDQLIRNIAGGDSDDE